MAGHGRGPGKLYFSMDAKYCRPVRKISRTEELQGQNEGGRVPNFHDVHPEPFDTYRNPWSAGKISHTDSGNLTRRHVRMERNGKREKKWQVLCLIGSHLEKESVDAPYDVHDDRISTEINTGINIIRHPPLP